MLEILMGIIEGGVIGIIFGGVIGLTFGFLDSTDQGY